MNTLVLFDSAFGNTQQIAKAVGATLSESNETPVIRMKDVLPEHLAGIELLVVGSPTRGFRPSEGTKKFLKDLPGHCLTNVKVAAFDTRVNIKEVNSGVLTFMVNLFGYAAEPIAKALQKKGGKLVAPPEGFFVEDKEGPLKRGELERAITWANRLASSISPDSNI